MVHPKLLKRREVERATLLSRASIYRRIAANDFPRPVKLGSRAVAWREDEIAEWIANRPVSTAGQPAA